VKQTRQDDLLAGAGALGQLCALERVRQLVDPLPSILPRGRLRHRLDQPVGHGGHGVEYTQP
jgi:hypothetical protein